MMKTILLCLLLLQSVFCSAQNVEGRVVDQKAQPVAFANVVLLNPKDSAFVLGTVTAEDGTFTLSTSRTSGLLKVSCVGYKTRFLKLRQGRMGDIQLQSDEEMLGEVVVKGRRPQYKLAQGGITVDVEHSLLNDVGTADELLSMLPRVQGSDGNFTVFAKGTPEIYINNRKVNDTRELKQLKANDVKSVDIITSPGARYSAETKAVIRIRTKKAQGEGLSAQLYSKEIYNHKWHTYDDATVKYRTGGLELSGNLWLNNSNYSEDNELNMDIYAKSGTVNILQEAPANYWNTTAGGKLSLSYDFDKDNSVGLSYNLQGSLYGHGGGNMKQTITRDGSVEGYVNQLMAMDINNTPQHEANLYYVGKAGKLGIDFNASWLWKKERRDNLSQEQSEELGDQVVTSSNMSHNRMLAGKLVLSYPVWKGELSGGMELTHSRSHGEFSNKEGLLINSDDEHKENNTAAFLEYSVELGHWSLGANLRYEDVSSKYYSFGEYAEGPSRSYHEWFPGVNIGWRKDKLSLQLSYNKGTTRPSYAMLNSNVQYDNRYMYEGGNPLLQPVISHGISLNTVYSWLTMGLGFNYNKDMITGFTKLYGDGNAVLTTAENVDRFRTCNASLTASPVFGFYRPTLSLFYWQGFDGEEFGRDHEAGQPMFSFSLRNWFVISKTMKAMFYLGYTTGYDQCYSHNRHQFSSSARVQKDFLDGKLTVALFGNDIFRTERQRWTDRYAVATISRDAYAYSQCVGLSLSLNLNATRSKYKGTGAGNAEKGRL